MTRMRLNLLGLCSLAALMAITTGCSNNLQKQCDELTTTNKDLSSQNADLKNQLETANKHEADLMAQLDARNNELAAERNRADRAASELQSHTAAAAPTGAETITKDGWVETDRTAKITVGTDVLFDAGKATLTQAGKRKVDEIANAIRTRYAGGTVLVYGHTDADPIRRTKNLWQDNLDLSANRAMSVTRELIGKGLSPKTIETIAMGEAHPVASNSTSAGKMKNRRVEIIVLKK